MNYQEESIALNLLEPRVRRALQRTAFDSRQGTTDQQHLYDAIFSNQTKFTAAEATLLAWHFSWGDNDLHALGNDATDAQVQVCTDAIQDELIARQNSRTLITGL